jgi:hypothetical protein
MPTGYTANIHDNKPESLTDFLTHLGRGMGAYVMQRDDDPNEPPKARTVSDYRVRWLVEARANLSEVENWTDAQRNKAYDKYVNETQRANADAIKRAKGMSQRYAARLAELNALDWSLAEAPGEVGEFFTGYKRFVYEQMETSIKFDCHEPYLRSIIPDAVTWHEEQIRSAQQSLESAEKGLNDEIERVAKQNHVHKAFTEWLQGIREDAWPKRA